MYLEACNGLSDNYVCFTCTRLSEYFTAHDSKSTSMPMYVVVSLSKCVGFVLACLL